MVRFVLHDVQLLTLSEQVKQGETHGLHVLLRGIKPAGQVAWHTFPIKLRVKHDVHIVWVFIHVSQSGVHG